MMVPRAFVYASNPQPRPKKLDEKEERRARLRRASANWNLEDTTTNLSKSSPAARPSSPPVSLPPSDPVGIPSRRGSGVSAATQHPQLQRKAGSSPTVPPVLNSLETKQWAVSSVEEVLASTAIPPRRKARGRKVQKLPPVNHVEEFSRLLQEDIKYRDDRVLSGSFKNSSLEILISPPNELTEDDVFVGSSNSTAFSIGRSVSTESMPSLERDDDSSTSASISAPDTPAAKKSTPERRTRMLSSSQDCASDHPLLHTDPVDTDEPPNAAIRLVPSPPPKRPSIPARSSSFRSNLTASLRALKSAAQTVSNFATPTTFRDEDFLTRAIFSFSPELTDDRRPAPSEDPPSPALRRYLNPNPSPSPASPAVEMHSYHELPHPISTEKRKNLASIQLQTYTRRTPASPSGASSPPIFISSASSPDGQVLGAEANACFYGAEGREREVRENADFLRTYAVENAMVKRGKIDEGTRRAKIWLPPRKVVKAVEIGRGDGERKSEIGVVRNVPRRWVAVPAGG